MAVYVLHCIMYIAIATSGYTWHSYRPTLLSHFIQCHAQNEITEEVAEHIERKMLTIDVVMAIV